jgi:predicted nucleic acid-binding protein
MTHNSFRLGQNSKMSSNLFVYKNQQAGFTATPPTKGGLGAGEAESIALASSRKLMVILDDKAARSFAEVMRITYLGTAGLLFQAFVKKNLTLAELEDAVAALSQTIWLSPAVVSDILRKARETGR